GAAVMAVDGFVGLGVGWRWYHGLAGLAAVALMAATGRSYARATGPDKPYARAAGPHTSRARATRPHKPSATGPERCTAVHPPPVSRPIPGRAPAPCRRE